MSNTSGSVPSDPPGPPSDGEVNQRIAHLLTEIQAHLGAMGNAVQILEKARPIYDERILELIERTTKTESAVPGLKETVDRHTTDLDGIGKVAHTADKLVRIALGILAAIAGPTLIYLYHHVTLVWK